MKKGVPEISRPIFRAAIEHDMFMDLHVGHRRILILQPALKTCFSSPEQR
jgi:hypothetical protein